MQAFFLSVCLSHTHQSLKLFSVLICVNLRGYYIWSGGHSLLLIVLICLLYITVSTLCCRGQVTGIVTQSAMTLMPRVSLSACPEQNSLSEVFKARRGWDGGWIGVQHVYWECEVIPVIAALESGAQPQYLQQCLRSRVKKMHRKRWKQLLIFVSSARGGEAAVCRAGKNMSSLSSVTHQLKKWILLPRLLFFAAWTNFWRNSWTLSQLTSVFWKP